MKKNEHELTKKGEISVGILKCLNQLNSEPQLGILNNII